MGEDSYYNGLQTSYAIGVKFLHNFVEFEHDVSVKFKNYELSQFCAKNCTDVLEFDK